MTNDLEEILRLIRFASQHRLMAEQGRALRQAITRLTALGLTIDDLLKTPGEVKAVPVSIPPPITRRKLPPPQQIADLVHKVRVSEVPIAPLFHLFRESGWPYTTKANNYSPERMKDWIDSILGTPTIRLRDLPTKAHKQQGLVKFAIDGWLSWYIERHGPLPHASQVNDSLEDLLAP
jgi:hypothetical protein